MKHQELEKILNIKEVSPGIEGNASSLEASIQRIYAGAKAKVPVSKAPVANLKESGVKIAPPSALKIQHIMNAIEESKKNW
jgi:hypothetical protein